MTTMTDEARIALDTLASRAAGLVNPSLRLGVTGLSRAGKTVFITSLVHNLLHGGRLPLFEAMKSGRMVSANLEHQPDDAVPRFQYEDHVAALVGERVWPESTRSISELRIAIKYESASAWGRMLQAGRLNLDLIDYPGEWLLDLPLLGKTFAEFSQEAFALSRSEPRASLARDWHEAAAAVSPSAPFEETAARRLHEAFTGYLRACKHDDQALSTLPPGRFLMPGDLDGSPAITFAPLPELMASAPPGSMQGTFERRFESYKTHVVKPFFREHIVRLDRQIVLVDAMQAMNAGPHAMADLQRALAEILSVFRPGRGNLFANLFIRTIDRILIAATKADHIHHENHNRLQAVVRLLADRAIERASFSGAQVDVLAMAAVRSTREGTVNHGGDVLPVIIGTPIKGERIDSQTFDGEQETAVFPGDLPDAPVTLLESAAATDMRFVRFRPPRLERDAKGLTLSLPHIRLDRALQFLIGDRLA